jgi:rhodanese-related sulfurtransferase
MYKLNNPGHEVGGPGAADMATKNPLEPFTRISVQEAKEMIERGGVQFIDTREMHEHVAGHAPGTTVIPHLKVSDRVSELEPDKDILFICQKGQRSALACEFAAASGFTRLFNVEGGHDAWVAAGYPMEK